MRSSGNGVRSFYFLHSGKALGSLTFPPFVEVENFDFNPSQFSDGLYAVNGKAVDGQRGFHSISLRYRLDDFHRHSISNSTVRDRADLHVILNSFFLERRLRL